MKQKIFIGLDIFLTPHKQCKSTEGTWRTDDC